MKTIEQVNEDIRASEFFISDNIVNIKKSTLNKEKKKIEFNRFVIKYLETNPKENFLKQERERLKTLIANKSIQFKLWLPPANLEPKKHKAAYNKHTGITEFNKQLKTIEYILG